LESARLMAMNVDTLHDDHRNRGM